MNLLTKFFNKLHQYPLWQRFRTEKNFILFRYLLVGLSNSFVCLSMMYLGALIGLHYLSYTALGYVVAILYSFFMNLHFTFRVQGKIVKRLTLFFTINLTNLGIVEVIEYIMIDIFHINHLISIFCAMSWYVVVGFLINNYLVYSRKIV